MANKPNALPPLPLQFPFVDPSTGLVSMTWQAYFRELDNRVGGRIGASNATLADQVAALQSGETALETDLEGIGQGRMP